MTHPRTTSYSFNAEVSKVLKLVIHSLYTNKDIFLRELISNASDACEKLRYLSLQDKSLSDENSEDGFLINIKIDKKKSHIIISDNGIGMDRDELVENLGTIAKSGTQDFLKKLKEARSSASNELIGQFGVGFYSSFMISDKIEVISKKASKEDVYSWTSDGMESFEITKLHEEFPYNSGTKIIINVKPEDVEYLDSFKVENIIATYSNNISIPITFEYIDDANNDKLEIKKINPKKTIWLRSKDEIKSEEYNEFFSSLCYIPGEPFLTLHNRIEGILDFTMLLYVPNSKPFDLYNPDRTTRVKLYVRKVFISEKDVNIIPKYLRFVYGVVDSNDLPLNISRETLQNNTILRKINDSVTKKIISELQHKADSDKENYLKFWDNFGGVLKEGLCESIVDKNALLKLCMFKSNKSTNMLLNLEQYIENMHEKQKDIYYAIGENINNIISAPEMEIFNKYNIEVLFLSDHVDSFWVNVVHDYKGKDFKNIARADIDFAEFKKKFDADNGNENDKKDESENNENDKKHNDEMTKLFMQNLQGKVSSVKITTKLVDSPACLSIGPGSMDAMMEKILLDNKQLAKKSLKVLEINPDNKIIKEIFDLLNSEQNEKQINGKELLQTVFELTMISHGETLDDPNNFVKRILKGYYGK